MKTRLAQRLRHCLLLTLLLCAWRPSAPASAPAQSAPARYLQGTVHGFLQMRSEDGRILASGDSVQTVRGNQVTTHTLFSFKDGSIDDETTVFSQRGAFRLITDHHLQKGPSFPHPMDLLIDTRSRQVTVRSTGKDGKEEEKTDHLDLPADLANGMVPLVVENIASGVAETTVPLLVLTPKPRLVKLVISSHGEEPFAVVGSSRKASHFEIKIEIGGLEGMVAPFVGKAPPSIDLWIIGGQAPTFLREQGPLCQDGPVMTIELASPVWPDSPKTGS
jgi:hypothetical protein